MPMQYKKKKGWNKKTIPISKRCAVRTAYDGLLKVFQEYKFHHTKRVSGVALVRVCCRTFDQLEDVSSATEMVFQKNLIAEIGMPLEHSYRMKTLVMYLKPVDAQSSIEIYNIFNQRTCAYRLLLVNPPKSQTKEKFAISSVKTMHILTRVNPILNVLVIIMTLLFIQYFPIRFIS
jgi:hypothetical protein